MEEMEIHVERRTIPGKSELNRLKKEGRVPGIVYDREVSIPISFQNDELRHIFSRTGEDVFLTFQLGSEKIRSKVKEVQRDPVTKEILHVDLMPQGGHILH